MSERLEPQNFWKDGSLGFGKMGVPPGHLSDQIFHALQSQAFDIMPLCSVLSQLHILCVAWLLPTPRIFSLKYSYKNLLTFTYFGTIDHTQSYVQRPLIPPMAFTSCHDQGSNRLHQDGRASTLTTQPIRLPDF